MPRLLVLLPLLFACSEADLLAFHELPADWQSASGERVHLQAFDAASFTPHGPAVSDGATTRATWYDVVHNHDDSLGVLVATGGAELVLYVDRTSAATWVVNPTAGGSSTIDSDAVQLEAGVQVQVLDETYESVRVRYLGDYLDVEVWIPRDDVDEVVQDEHIAPEHDAGTDNNLLVRVPTVLYDAPDGAFLGELTSHRGDAGWQSVHRGDDAHYVHQRGKGVDGFLPVNVQDGSVRVTAWIEAEDALDTPSSMGMHGWSGRHSWRSMCGGVAFYGDWPYAPEGTTIYDKPEGRPIGEYVTDTLIRDMLEPESDGWTPVELSTDWGPVEVWVEPGAIANTSSF